MTIQFRRHLKTFPFAQCSKVALPKLTFTYLHTSLVEKWRKTAITSFIAALLHKNHTAWIFPLIWSLRLLYRSVKSQVNVTHITVNEGHIVQGTSLRKKETEREWLEYTACIIRPIHCDNLDTDALQTVKITLQRCNCLTANCWWYGHHVLLLGPSYTHLNCRISIIENYRDFLSYTTYTHTRTNTLEWLHNLAGWRMYWLACRRIHICDGKIQATSWPSDGYRGLFQFYEVKGGWISGGSKTPKSHHKKTNFGYNTN